MDLYYYKKELVEIISTVAESLRLTTHLAPKEVSSIGQPEAVCYASTYNLCVSTMHPDAPKYPVSVLCTATSCLKHSSDILKISTAVTYQDYKRTSISSRSSLKRDLYTLLFPVTVGKNFSHSRSQTTRQ